MKNISAVEVYVEWVFRQGSGVSDRKLELDNSEKICPPPSSDTRGRPQGLESLQPSVEEHFPLVQRLHTDVLEERYGPVTADVLQHDNRVRQVHLRDKTGVSRTFAITLFPDAGISDSLKKIDGNYSPSFSCRWRTPSANTSDFTSLSFLDIP